TDRNDLMTALAVLLLLKLRQIFLDWIVEPELAALDKPHGSRNGYRLSDRGDPAERVGRHWPLAFAIAQAKRFFADDFSLLSDQRDCSRHTVFFNGILNQPK